MNMKSYFAGILTATLCAFAGYMLGHTNPAAADPGGTGGGGMILATPSSADAGLGSLVYVMKTEPAEDAALICYRNTGKGDMELVSARRITWDLKVWDLGTKGMSPEKIKEEIEKAEKIRKEHEKAPGGGTPPH